jgi:hypothetical protein
LTSIRVNGVTFFYFQIGEALVRAQPCEEAVDRFAQAGKEQVDAFRAQQDRAFQAQLFTERAKFGSLLDRIVEGNEFVGGYVDVRGSSGLHNWQCR